ncbi:MAG TPA: phosphoglucomutase/phosphomannomutase family protein, partial [Halobacteriales archaeon]|nr:phosphoglucomutase/phosphomannomutase family protein [Halobacteriales archaeon]
GPAVRTVSTTFLVDRIAEAHGESVYETPVGFKWVAEAMADHDALMGGEESGGFSVRGHVREKDGVLMALLAAAAAAEEPFEERVARLLDEHGEVHQSRVSVGCPDSEKTRVVGEIEAALPERVAGVDVERVNDADGFKVLLADGSWLLVRPSGTEPKLRVYAEAESEGRVAELLEAGQALVEPLV